MEDQPKRELEALQPGAFVVKQSDGGGDFEDYVKLEADEPYKAYVYDVKVGKKLNRNSGEEEDRLYFYFKLDDPSLEEGNGQTYRGDYAPKLSKPGASMVSNLSKLCLALTGEVPTQIDPPALKGYPCRITLSDPWGEKQLQFVRSFLKPSKGQKSNENFSGANASLPNDEDVDAVNLDAIPF